MINYAKPILSVDATSSADGFSLRCFSPPDGERLGFVMRGLRWFHRQQLLSHGLLIANAPLTPAERRVLLALLDGQMEKQIAQRHDQSPNATHFHVKSIYGKFGVRNRSALAALWLGKLR